MAVILQVLIYLHYLQFVYIKETLLVIFMYLINSYLLIYDIFKLQCRV